MMLRNLLFALTFCAVAVNSPPGFADIGGFIVLPEEISADGSKEQDRIALSSYSWDYEYKGEMTLESQFRSPIARTPPENGVGKLIVGIPGKTPAGTLRDYCDSGNNLAELIVDMPVGGPLAPRHTEHQLFKLKGVTVTNCAYEEGAIADILFLNFSDIEAISDKRLLN